MNFLNINSSDRTFITASIGGNAGLLGGHGFAPTLGGNLDLRVGHNFGGFMTVSGGAELIAQSVFERGGVRPNLGGGVVADMTALGLFGVQANLGVTNAGVRVGGGPILQFPIGPVLPGSGVNPFVRLNLSANYQGRELNPAAVSGFELNANVSIGGAYSF